jgi:eukaryotic-like serine/threonine-protein kinase
MDADGESPQVVVGRYMLYGALASGGMATVHLGRLIGPAGFSRTVAIKRLHEQFARDPHFVSGLLDEARLSARIGHPNVVPTLDVVATDDQLLLVMEYVQGESLSRLLRASKERGDRVPLRIAIGIMAGALHGLHAAHEAKSEKGEALHIVHRDVSPQNIIVGVDGVARVLDFGVAKAVGRLQDTLTGQLKGKLSYMAPEQISSAPIDRRTDVFAASIVLWEVLTLQRLFARESEAATMGDLLFSAIEPPSKYSPDLSPELDAVVMRGLSRDPAQRFPTAREMAVALEDLVPPATAAQTGDWVRGLAEEALSGRAKRVRDIESATSDMNGVENARTSSRSVSPEATTSSKYLESIQELPTSPPRLPVAETIARRLAAYLGPHTSKVAVKTFSMKALGRGPETLTLADIPALQAALRPMLRTFIGRAQCEQVLEAIARELSP